MAGIENARSERQLRPGNREPNTNLLLTSYHTLSGIASESRRKGNADTADRPNFPRLDLSAARKGDASTYPSAVYHADLRLATARVSRGVA